MWDPASVVELVAMDDPFPKPQKITKGSSWLPSNTSKMQCGIWMHSLHLRYSCRFRPSVKVTDALWRQRKVRALLRSSGKIEHLNSCEDCEVFFIQIIRLNHHHQHQDHQDAIYRLDLYLFDNYCLETLRSSGVDVQTQTTEMWMNSQLQAAELASFLSLALQASFATIEIGLEWLHKVLHKAAANS